jgi:hypothetical protein
MAGSFFFGLGGPPRPDVPTGEPSAWYIENSDMLAAMNPEAAADGGGGRRAWHNGGLSFDGVVITGRAMVMDRTADFEGAYPR